MPLIINAIAGIILLYYAIRIYSTQHLLTVKNPCNGNQKITVNRNLHFLLFSIATAMVFLGPLSLVKYIFWILILGILCFTRSFVLRIDGIVGCYLMFVLWAVFSMTYSSEQYQGLMLIIKYILPLLYLWLGYNAINTKEEFILFLKVTLTIMIVYAFLIGGFSAKIYPIIYNAILYRTGGLFIAYASLADFFSALIVVPLALYIIYRKKSYLAGALIILMSTLLEVVRTGLGGIALAISFFFFIIYKIKAIPCIAVCLIGLFSVFMFVPSVREKMFIDGERPSGTEISFDSIQSNGREFIWETNLDRFYTPSPVIGSGLGESVAFTKDNFSVHLIHSDYIQILCDMGLVGIVLFGLFFLTVISKVFRSLLRYKDDFILLTGAMAAGSCAAVFFSMAFDNVITYSQQCFVIPFAFIGIFNKSLDLYHHRTSRV